MLNQGDVLQDRYRVVSLLGKGGMGAVYRAWDTRLSIPVALKEMIAQPDLDTGTLQDLRTQFQQEATVLARLSHPHLVGVTDYFHEGRSVYLVMKYVEGESLSDRIQRLGPVAEAQAIAWSAQLLDALSYCHGQGVIHRDIKPQNIIIGRDGEAVLVDFGLVKLWDPNDPRTRTAVRGVGTPQYAPPEQYEMSAGHTEPRSDLYSVGATMYHALTGQAPPSATMRIAAPEDFAPIRSVARGISSSTAAVIERAMELARSKRWGTAAEMGRALNVEVRDWGQATGPVANVPAPPKRGGTLIMDRAVSPVAPVAQGAARRPPDRPKHRRRVPLWIPASIVAVVGLGAVAVVAALALTGIVDIGLPASWTPWLSTSVPTPEATEEVLPPTSPTPTRTATPRPAATSTATPALTATPKTTSTAIGGSKETEPLPATPTSTPTATPTPRPPTATTETVVEPSPTSSPSSVSTGALVDFEAWGNWRRGDEPYGDLVQTQEQVKGGQYAARLTYQFPAVANDYVVFVQPRSVGGQPDTFSAWVYGDGSGQYLNLWIKDAQDEYWAVHLGAIGGSGWQQMSGGLAPGLAWPAGHVSGPDNGSVDYPVQFYAIVLDRPADNQSQGTIYIDEIWASGQGAAIPVPTSTVAVQATPVPPTSASASNDEIGRIILTVQTSDGYYLYSADPEWSQMREIGAADYNQSTCAGTAAASTHAGQTISLHYTPQCAVTERSDACESPDGKHKLITDFQPGWTYAVLLQDVTDGTDEFIYQGSMNSALGVQWDGTSQVAYFGKDTAINVIRVGAGGYQQAVSLYEQDTTPRFTPDGSAIFYLKPTGSQGNSDVFVVEVDGSGDRNLTNAPEIAKMCPRWRV